MAEEGGPAGAGPGRTGLLSTLGGDRHASLCQPPDPLGRGMPQPSPEGPPAGEPRTTPLHPHPASRPAVEAPPPPRLLLDLPVLRGEVPLQPHPDRRVPAGGESAPGAPPLRRRLR